MYEKSTYRLQDIFGEETIKNLKSTNFSLEHVDTLYFGRCFTICSLRVVEANEFLTLCVKRDFDLKMIVHLEGEAAWLSGEDGKSPTVDGLTIEVLKTRYYCVLKMKWKIYTRKCAPIV